MGGHAQVGGVWAMWLATCLLALLGCARDGTVEIRFVLDGNVSMEDASAVETIEVTLDLPDGTLTRTVVVEGAFEDREASLGLPLAGRSGLFSVSAVARIGARVVATGALTDQPLEGGLVRVLLTGGGATDGGVGDAGRDAGLDASSEDAGIPDGGTDAGTDGGTDAGPDCPVLGDCSRGTITGITTSAEDSFSTRTPHTHVIVDGLRWAWGDNTQGQLGVGFRSGDLPPSNAGVPPGGGTWADVGAGLAHACGISTVGDLYCWGSNLDGALGVGGEVGLEANSPMALPRFSAAAWVSVHVAPRFSCARNAESHVYCWGRNHRGQIGMDPPDGGSAVVAMPRRISSVDGGVVWTAVSAGGDGACGVTPSGGMECWGSNEEGGLGSSTFDAEPHPVPQQIIGGATGWTAVSVGERVACGLQGTRGSCWGHAGSAGLRPGAPSADLLSATEVSPGTEWVALEAGVDTVCGLRTDGVLVCMGAEQNGVVGTGTAEMLFRGPAPVMVSPRPLFTRFSARGRHACAVTCEHAVYCWGRNDNRELGRAGPLAFRPARTCVVDPVP